MDHSAACCAAPSTPPAPAPRRSAKRFVAREKAKLQWLTKRAARLSAHPQSTARQILAVMSGLDEQWLREEGRLNYLIEFVRALKALLPG